MPRLQFLNGLFRPRNRRLRRSRSHRARLRPPVLERLESRTLLSGAPVFGSSSYSYSISEDAASTASVGGVSATDPDAPLIYSFGGSYAGTPFAIDEGTGAITVQDSLDYESASSYSLNAYATDDEGEFSSVPVTITITDVAGDPVFDSIGSMSVDEDAPVGTVVGSVTATDPDGVTYALITSGVAGDGLIGINSTSGQLTTQAELDYEALSSIPVTVKATDGTGVHSTTSFTISVNDIDETPAINNTPTASGLTFDILQDGQGVATGLLRGSITDDYVTDGWFKLEVDIDADGTIDWTDEAPSRATDLASQMDLPYGSIDLSVRLTETENETGTAIIGGWTTESVVVTAPPNAAPVLANLAWEDDPDGPVSEQGFGYASGEIVDSTRPYGTYNIQVDWDADSIADDNIDFPYDASTFAFEYSAPAGVHTLAFRIVETDLNQNIQLEGSWASFTFSVAEPVNRAPALKTLDYSEPMPGFVQLTGTGEDSSYGSTYELQADFDSDGITDEVAQAASLASFTAMMMVASPPTGLFGVRLVETSSGGTTIEGRWEQVDAAVGQMVANDTPTFPNPSYEFTVAQASVTAGQNVGTVTANDSDPLKYSLKQPGGPWKVGGAWHLKKGGKPLAINPTTGEITVANEEALKKALTGVFVTKYKYDFTVIADDGNETASVAVSIVDDHMPYLALIPGRINTWAIRYSNWVTQTHFNSRDAVNRLDTFYSSGISAFVSNAGTAASYLEGKVGTGSAAGIALRVSSWIAKGVASHLEAGHAAMIAQIKREMVNQRDADYLKITQMQNQENQDYAGLIGDIAGLSQLEKTKKVRDYWNATKHRLPITIPVAATDDIYGELLLSLVREKGWTIKGSVWTKNMVLGSYWKSPSTDWPFIIDATEVADELNGLGYEKGARYSIE